MSTSLASREPAPMRGSLVAVIILTFLTFGFYIPFWFLRRRRWLNRLDSPVRIGFGLLLLMLAFQAGAFTIRLMGAPYREQGLGLPASLSISGFAVSIVQLLILFKLAYMVREILSDHLKKVLSALSGHPAQYVVELSGIMTLVFSIWYLQYKINECANFSEHWTALVEQASVAQG